MEDGRIFLKISAPLSLIKTYRLNLISAGSISLDSTLKSSLSGKKRFLRRINQRYLRGENILLQRCRLYSSSFSPVKTGWDSSPCVAGSSAARLGFRPCCGSPAHWWPPPASPPLLYTGRLALSWRAGPSPWPRGGGRVGWGAMGLC
jgi:hypothetical protein